MSKEAMKLALELFEQFGRDSRLKYEHQAIYKTIVALKEALANHIPDNTKMVSGVKDSLTTQQKQGKSFFKFRECEDSQANTTPQPKQEQGELVAWRNAAIRVGEDLCSVGPFGYYDMTAKQWLDWALSVVTVHLPPQQRTWEGLSVFEINDLVENTEYEDYCDLVERTEAKLRSKNT